MSRLKTLAFVVIRIISYATPVFIAVAAIVQLFIPQSVKESVYPQAIEVAVVVLVMFLLAQFVLAYRMEDAIYRRESVTREVANCIEKGEELKSKIVVSWTSQLLVEVEQWESETERVIAKYYKEIIPVFRATSDNPELHFNPRADSILDLRNRMSTKLNNLSQIISITARR